MSTLKTINVQHPSSGSANITLDASGNATAAGNLTVTGGLVPSSSMAWRNRIINGDMRIDQRNNGAAVTGNTSTYVMDRWHVNAFEISGLGVTRQRTTVAPAGFTNSLLWNTTTAVAPTASAVTGMWQAIEGLNIADLSFGTASARAVTLSFWVNTSVTGTHSGVVCNGSGNRAYAFTYTVAAANTWTQYSVTIPGDTAGTWATDSTAGMYVIFNGGSGTNRLIGSGSWTTPATTFPFGATGSVQLAGISGATFYLTGVQLERGSVATPFEYVEYGEQLRRCQRYAWVPDGSVSVGGAGSSSTAVAQRFLYPTPMRAGPTVSVISAGSYSISDDYASGHTAATVSVSSASTTTNGAGMTLSGFSPAITVGRWYGGVPGNSSTARILFSAEL